MRKRERKVARKAIRWRCCSALSIQQADRNRARSRRRFMDRPSLTEQPGVTHGCRKGGPSSVILMQATQRSKTMLQDFPMYAYIPAKDMARARQFYEAKVGLKAKEERNGGVV